MRRALGLTLALLLAFAACNGDDENSGGTTTTTTPARSTTTSADPFAIPDTIDEAYAQRVVDELDRIDSTATRIILRERRLVPEAAEHLGAVYVGPELDEQLRLWNDDIANGLDEYLSPPGDVRTTVTKLLSAKQECLRLEANRDFSAVSRSVSEAQQVLLTLVPKVHSQDTRALNPTPWMVRAALAPATTDQSQLC